LTVPTVKETGEKRTRAGTQALSLLAAPLNVAILQALEEGPTSLIDLRCAIGSPPPTTLRKNLQMLTDLGVLERIRRNDFPGPVDYEVTRSGLELLEVATVVSAWLSVSPEGSVPLGTTAARSAIKALVDGWSTNILRALAARPLALTELDKLITRLSYPSLERRLVAMRIAGQVEKCPGQARGTPHAVTDWLRRAVAPLLASAHWELRHLGERAVRVTNLDAEAAFLLALPLVNLSEDHSGTCRLAVEEGDAGRSAGALARVEAGKVVACTSLLQGEAAASAAGSLPAWLHAVTERNLAQIELGGGDRALAAALVEGLSRTLFEVAPRGGASLRV
jgi:DNA-binding HxlR family transcriptional regulator